MAPRCGRGYVSRRREGLHLHVVGGTATPLCGRGCHAVWEGSRPTLWAGLCDAVWERTHSVLSEGRCPSSVGGVTSYSMRGVVSRTVGGATPPQRGMALSQGVEGAASCSMGGAVMHCGQAVMFTPWGRDHVNIVWDRFLFGLTESSGTR